MYKAWHLAAMEDAGYMDTSDGLVNRVAREIAKSDNDIINTSEFMDACYKCNVDPYSFTDSDMKKLQRKLNQIT